MCASLGKSLSPGLLSSGSSAIKEQQLMVALHICPISEAEVEEGAALVACRVGEQIYAFRILLVGQSISPRLGEKDACVDALQAKFGCYKNEVKWWLIYALIAYLMICLPEAPLPVSWLKIERLFHCTTNLQGILQQLLVLQVREAAMSITNKACRPLHCMSRVILIDPSEDPDDILRVFLLSEKGGDMQCSVCLSFPHLDSPDATHLSRDEELCLPKSPTDEEVYVSTTKRLIAGVISGYNATIFVGPTGARKTYTMLGMDCEPGIYIHTLDDLFKALEATTEGMDYRVSVFYLEIYNEVIRDLLNPSSGFLDLREYPRGSIQIAGITEVSTTNAQEIMQLLTKGNKQHTQEPTAANKTSSRSHAVLQVIVMQKSGKEVRIGKLFMVNLAGLERAAQTQNQGKRMKEGAHINCSLLALGNCINALSKKGGSRVRFVSFRDSKLPCLLKDLLGGNSRTVMIAHISPASTFFEESRMTLIYAYRARNIKTQVKCNLQNASCHIDQYASIVADLHREIEHLKERVEDQEKEKSAVRSDLGDLQGRARSKNCSGRQQGSEAHSGQVMNTLRAQLMGAFRQQMEMCRSLVELGNTNTELHIDTCRHFLTITDWEREKAQCVCKHDKPAKEEKDENTEEEDRDIINAPEPHEVTVAREEINLLLVEQCKTMALKKELEQHLANTKEKASQMEFFPRQITSEDQQEVLRLLCRAHELELGNTDLQANTLYKENLLCQKDFVIQQLQHMLLCEESIQQQQILLKAQNIPVPEPLGRLYHLHQSELEEGTLNRLLLLHSVMSSMLRPHNSPSLVISQHLDLNKDEVRKGLPGNMKNHPWGVKFDIPSITLESYSGSCKSSKTTPCRKEGSLDIHLSPTFSSPKGPVQQTCVGGSQRHCCWSTEPEDLKEMTAHTKNITLTAGRCCFRAQHSDHGSEGSSPQFTEEDMLELKIAE
ncbi:LOW QUALITY PROTEIN: kinesin-like protein KIF19, partial [Rhynochetos jubatus]